VNFKRENGSEVTPLKRTTEGVKGVKTMPGDATHTDPGRLLEHLNREVYGQRWAKEKLTDALAYNQERLRLIRSGVPASDLPAKANVLLIGPTGCGKTFLTSTAAKFCKLPYYYTTATEYSSPGYTGKNLDSMISGLVEAAGGSVIAAERGIIFVDEIDKVRRRNFGGQDDVAGESVQHGLLTMLEGTTVNCPLGSVDTSGITFVAGGAFSNLSERIGPDGQRQFEAAELRNFGLIPEFIGRFPLRVGLSPLSAEDLRRLLLECQSSTLWKTRNLFRRHGIELSVDDAVVDAIINRAQQMGTGARGLDEMVKDRCLGLMSRISELPRRGVTRVIVREDGITEERSPRARLRAAEPSVQPPRIPSPPGPPLTDHNRPTFGGGPGEPPEIPTAEPPSGEVLEGESHMPLKGWVTLALAVLLLVLGLSALRSSPSRPNASAAGGPAAERVPKGLETPSLWRDLQRGRTPK
jgi:ATP-dependent Clp protease ATP-binding subunit ClpX